jgi:tetratricopeptide (TPR) repeat protein
MASGEPIAPAVNGLGVAYARLGRFDLAQRYFQQAMASDPTNTKYADNLAKLMRSPTLAMRRDGDIAGAALKAAIPFRGGDLPAQAVRDASAVGKLQRVSRGEVRIASAPPLPAPAATAQAKIDVRFHPPVRVSLAEPTATRAISLAQVVWPESKLATTEPDPAASSTDQAAIRH